MLTSVRLGAGKGTSCDGRNDHVWVGEGGLVEAVRGECGGGEDADADQG